MKQIKEVLCAGGCGKVILGKQSNKRCDDCKKPTNTQPRYSAVRKEWRNNNRLKMRAYNLNFRSKKMGRPGKLTGDDLADLFKKEPSCRDCGSTEKLDVGHGIPLVYPAGTNTLANLFVQCRKCNFKQGWFVHPDFASDEIAQWLPIWNNNNHNN